MQKILTDTTLVCATLGNENKIKELLVTIYTSSALPCKIIIVTFKKIDISILEERLKQKRVSVEILQSSKAAQVYQRNIGINKVKTKFVIQCDDDILMLHDSIEMLHYASNLFKDAIISPKVIMPNGNSIYLKNKFSSFLNGIIFFIFNLRFPKNCLLMSKSGRNYAPLKINLNHENEWLPSCLMYPKEIFQLAITYEDESGKGYYEDIIFTHSLFKRNIRLIIFEASVFLHPKIEDMNYGLLSKVFKKQLVVCEIFKLSKFAALIDYILYIIFLSAKKVFKWVFI